MNVRKFKARVPLSDEKKKYFANVVFLYGWGLFGQKKVYSPNLIDLISFEVDPGYFVDYPTKNITEETLLPIIDEYQDIWEHCND